MNIKIVRFEESPKNNPTGYTVGFSVTSSTGRMIYRDTRILFEEADGLSDNKIVELAWNRLKSYFEQQVAEMDALGPLVGSEWKPIPDGSTIRQIVRVDIEVDEHDRKPIKAHVSFCVDGPDGQRVGTYTETFSLEGTRITDLLTNLTPDQEGILRDQEGKAVFVTDDVQSALLSFWDYVVEGIKLKNPQLVENTPEG